MPATTFTTAGDILNRVAAEVGLSPANDPFSSGRQEFAQMKYLLLASGEQLLMTNDWPDLVREHAIATQSTDSGDYDLPEDFFRMINQTGWERSQQVPLFGPLSPQDWQYLEGRNLVSNTIYASFRISEGKFKIFPQPPPNGLNIHFEYLSKNWIQDGDDGTYKDHPDREGDIVLYDRTLITRYLKVKWLEAKGFDTSKAQDDLNQVFSMVTGGDRGAPLVNIGRGPRGLPLIDAYRNTPDTGYGYPFV